LAHQSTKVGHALYYSITASPS